ncbi:IS3 family transposase [Merdibacter massiliensis]|uniref:IS3 family transposase n=1 Tax=Merdibacter massiliensis TaxID=1871030 RepID=UPI00117B441D|nr:IS3 family transposase [Merdibacter massiliensis]
MISQGEKAKVIKELVNKEGYRLSDLLKASKLPRSTYYFESNKSNIDDKNKEIINEIKTIFYDNKQRYGVRRVTAELHNRGHIINHKKVQRLMFNLGLKGKRPKEKYHSYKGDIGKKADNIIHRDFKATKPNQKWTTDVSQFNFSWGKCYLSPILDMYNDEIISYDLSLHPNLEQIINMLNKAFNKYDSLDDLIFHSDQGWQYQHQTFIDKLNEKGITQSMSRKGNCYDNSIMESFFGTLK